MKNIVPQHYTPGSKINFGFQTHSYGWVTCRTCGAHFAANQHHHCSLPKK